MITSEDLANMADNLDYASRLIGYDAWALERENRARNKGRTIYIPCPRPNIPAHAHGVRAQAIRAQNAK